MKIKCPKWMVVTFTIAIGFLACEDPVGPQRDKPDVVTDRAELTGQPGGEGSSHKMIRICTQYDGCNTFKPSQVKDCKIGSNWPSCANL